MTKHNSNTTTDSGDPLLELEALARGVSADAENRHPQPHRLRKKPVQKFAPTGITAPFHTTAQAHGPKQDDEDDPRPQLDLILLTRRLFTGLRDDPATRAAATTLIHQIKADHQRDIDNWRKRHAGNGGGLHLNCPTCQCGGEQHGDPGSTAATDTSRNITTGEEKK